MNTDPAGVTWVSNVDELELERVEPTVGLRWRNGVLEQAHQHVTYKGGVITAGRFEWQPVPHVPDDK